MPPIKESPVAEPSRAGTGRKSRPRRTSHDTVKLEDVARLAGVSTITVSRALNQPDKVAAATLAKVKRAIDQTGYVPNLLAGGLASRRTRLIAAIVPSLSTLVYAVTIQSFSRRLREAGYQVMLGESGYPELDEQNLVSAVLSRRPDGILLTGVNHSADCRRLLLTSRVPVVEIWDLTPNPLDMVVGFSHERVGEAVARYLLDKGCRNIALVTADDRRAQVRRRALLAELAAHGITDVPVAQVPASTDLHRGRMGLAQLLDQGFKGGAVFCSSDTLAHGVLIEAQARGIRIPQDLAILGFGDQSFAADTFPALSSVRINGPRMGQLAAESLLARLDEKPVTSPVMDVGFEIIERGTT